MKIQMAIKGRESIMYSFSISPTERIQHQVKYFVFIK